MCERMLAIDHFLRGDDKHANQSVGDRPGADRVKRQHVLHDAERCRSVLGALAELERCSGSQFDPQVVKAFRTVVEAEVA